MAKNTTSLRISNRSIFISLVVVVLTLLTIHLVLQAFLHLTSFSIPDTLVGRFDVDNEISIPTWWSQIVLLASAVLGLIVWRAGGSRWWISFSALFLFLSIDEGAMLHEAFVTKIREYTTDGSASGLANHLWLVPVGIVFVILLVPFVKFVRTLPKRSMVLLAGGMGLLFFGAVVYETIGLIIFEGARSNPFWYQGVNVAIEEAFEMFGASLIVYSVLEEIRRLSPKIDVALQK